MTAIITVQVCDPGSPPYIIEIGGGRDQMAKHVANSIELKSKEDAIPAMHRALASALHRASIRHDRLGGGDWKDEPVPSGFTVTIEIRGWDVALVLEETFSERVDGGSDAVQGP